MASIRKRTLAPDAKGRPRTAYQVRWIDPQGHEQSAQFKRLEDARAKRIEVESEIQRGTYIDPRAGRVSFREFAEQWRAIQVHRSATASTYERTLRLHVYPTLGDRGLNSIRRSDIQALGKRLEGVLAPSSVGKVLNIVTAVFSAAVLDGIIAQSPVQKISRPKGKRIISIPTADEVFATAESVSERYQRLVRVAAGTGLRQGELAALSLGSVDFLRRTVTVDAQLITPDKGPVYLGPPKSAAGYRTIPVATEVIEELSAQVAEFGTLEFEGRELIFSSRWGRPLRRNVMTGIVPGGWHQFRHFYAACLLAEVPNIKLVQVRLGHENASETLDTYGHLLPDAEDASREALSKVFRAQKKAPSSEEPGA